MWILCVEQNSKSSFTAWKRFQFVAHHSEFIQVSSVNATVLIINSQFLLFRAGWARSCQRRAGTAWARRRLSSARSDNCSNTSPTARRRGTSWCRYVMVLSTLIPLLGFCVCLWLCLSLCMSLCVCESSLGIVMFLSWTSPFSEIICLFLPSQLMHLFSKALLLASPKMKCVCQCLYYGLEKSHPPKQPSTQTLYMYWHV